PYDWKDALKFEGSWDYAFAKNLFYLFNLDELQPLDIVLKDTEEIRVAISKNSTKIAIYVPVNTVLTLNMPLEDYIITIIDLEHRRFGEASVTYKEDKTTIDMHQFESDVIIIGERQI